MVENILSALSTFFLTALSALALQNVLLGRALGIGEAHRMEDEAGQRMFCLLQTVCSLLSGAGFWAVRKLLLPHLRFLTGFGVSEYYAEAYLWPLAMTLVTAGVFFLVFVLAVKLAPYDLVTTAAKQLPFAAFSNVTAGVLMLSAANDYGIWRMLAFSLGSSLGYTFASVLLREGRRKLQGREMPPAFRGLPAELLYLSGLALAAYALAGHSLPNLI